MYAPRQFVERVDQSAVTRRPDPGVLSPTNHDDSVSLYATMSRGNPSVVSHSRSSRGHCDGGDARLKRAVSAPMSSRPGPCGSIIDEASDSDDDDEQTSDYVLYNPAQSPSPRPPPPAPAAAAAPRDTTDPRQLSRHSTSVVHMTRPSADQLKRKTELVRELSLHCGSTRVNSTTTTPSTSSSSRWMKTSQDSQSDDVSDSLRSSVADTERSQSNTAANSHQTIAPSLLDKEGAVQCRHSRENGKLVPRQEWTEAYLMLTGPIICFYKNEVAARKKPDGSYSMPDSSIVLQGSTIQLTGRDQNTFDVLLITSATNTQYFIQTSDVSETQSWCYHLKHNVAVLLAERSARMQLAKPVSTFTGGHLSPPSTPVKSPRGILTYFESEMSRIAEMLRDLLLRRPSKEDLERRGIYKEPMFGASLDDVCAKDNNSVPLFIVSCFRKIEERGLDTAGIYRHSGSVSKIQKLRIQANQGEYDVSDYDIHVLTGAVKLFFRELSQPLIPVDLLDHFIIAYRRDDEQVRRSECAALIQRLPSSHRHTLHQLIVHLERVAEHSDVNQMTPHNLAIVFGPTLMWSTQPSTVNSLSTTVVLQGKLVEYFITDRQTLFST